MNENLSTWDQYCNVEYYYIAMWNINNFICLLKSSKYTDRNRMNDIG